MPMGLVGKAMRRAEMTLTRMAGIAPRHVGKALRLTVRTMRLVRMAPGLTFQDTRLVGIPQD